MEDNEMAYADEDDYADLIEQVSDEEDDDEVDDVDDDEDDDDDDDDDEVECVGTSSSGGGGNNINANGSSSTTAAAPMEEDNNNNNNNNTNNNKSNKKKKSSSNNNNSGANNNDVAAVAAAGGGGGNNNNGRNNNNNGNNNNANNNANNVNNNNRGGNNNNGRLSDQVNMDDEPVLQGYERTDMIGQGAYGIVYKGRKEDTGDIVAIKRIPFADSTPEGGVPCNVIREISLLRELDHPNVVKLLDIIQAHPGGLYLVFEYVSHDLKTYMDQYQTSDDIIDRIGLNVNTVRSFLKQIISGVGCCHTYRILHRDLKPHNLLITGNGKHVKLADFGLARLSAIPNGPYTFEVVTLWYRAPELLLGANRYSTAVDVWSIGCIFAEMATGMPLFPGRSDIDQLFKIFQRRGTPTADIWPAVIRLPHYNAEFPQWRERNITDYVNPSVLGGRPGADLLTKLLQYDPDRRIACKTALQHPFFMQE